MVAIKNSYFPSSYMCLFPPALSLSAVNRSQPLQPQPDPVKAWAPGEPHSDEEVGDESSDDNTLRPKRSMISSSEGKEERPPPLISPASPPGAVPGS